MIVTLLTDFGTADYYVGAMKGVILSRCPGATIVDLTHEIPPQDVAAGAFVLLASYREFPEGTVHVAVVDPGVGSTRRPIAAAAGGWFFVGPDNGLFGGIFAREGRPQVVQLTNDRYVRQPVSETFHGRDLFAPAAAALAARVPLGELGPAIDDPVAGVGFENRRLPDGTIEGTILHVDRFGNCVTSFTPADLGGDGGASGLRLQVVGRTITSVRRFYADEGVGSDELFLIWGSTGLLEIAMNRDSAARRLSVGRGEMVRIEG